MSTDLDDDLDQKKIYDDDKPTWKDSVTKENEALSSSDPSDIDEEDAKTASAASLQESETKAGKNKNPKEDTTTKTKDDDQIGSGFSEEPDSRFGKTFAKIKQRRKQIAIGGGVTAIIGGAGVTFFMGLLPLKVLSTVNNIQDKYFASSESAVGDRVEYHFNNYLVKHVFKSLKGTGLCSSTKNLDRSCVDPIPGKGPVATLYRGWQDARLETKMADNLGFEISRKPGTAEFILSIDGKNSPVDVDGFLKNPSNGLFQATGGRNDIRMAIKQSLDSQTRWKKVMYRYKVGALMERKYGIRRCVFACKIKDDFDDWKDNKKNGFKAVIARRVLEPRAETLGLALGCIFSTSCDNDTSDTDGNDQNDHEKKDKLQKNIEKYLAERGKTYSADSVAKLTDAVAGITESGSLSKYIVKKVVTKAFNEAAGELAEKSIPVIGYVDAAAQYLAKIKNAGPKFKKWAFAVNSAGMAAQWALYRSSADELKGGATQESLIGGVAASLDGMEKSPMYVDVMQTNEPSSVSSLLLPSVLAESTGGANNEDPFVCDDGNPPPAGKKICPEESLEFDNFLTGASDLFKQPPLEQFGAVADAWNATGGKVYNAIGGLVGGLVGLLPLDALSEQLASILQPLMDQAAKIIPNPFSLNPSGGRSFNIAAAGANVSGNYFAQFGTGGKLLTPQQSAEIRTRQVNEAKAEFEKQPLYARLFNTENSKSLISQVALKVPSSADSYPGQAFASLATNPFTKMLSNFGSFFRTSPAFAANAEPDAFGVPQYGYPVGDPALTQPAPDDCDAYNKAWAQDTTVDPVSGQDVHNRVNICLLDVAAAGSGAGYFTQDVLTPEDLGKSTTTATTEVSNPTSPGEAINPTSGLTWPLLQTKAIAKSNLASCLQVAKQSICQAGHPYKAHDLFASRGTPVVAAAKGKVISSKVGTCGHKFNTAFTVQVYDEASNITYFYQHMDPNIKGVVNGAVINPGDRIGVVGPSSAACNTPPHLHIDAVVGRGRKACSRLSCSAVVKASFVDISQALYKGYDVLQ